MMAWPRAHLLPLLAAALTTLLASIATAQQFDPETLPQGTWTNKVAGSFASGLAGWTCSGAARTTEVPTNEPDDITRMFISPSSGAPLGEEPVSTGLWMTDDNQVTCSSAPFSLNGGRRRNYWYLQAASVVNIKDSYEMMCTASLKPTGGGTAVKLVSFTTRPLNVDAKELPALTERLAGTVGLTPLCRHRVGDDPDERPRRYELTHVVAPLDMEQAREDEQYVFDQPEAPLFDPFLEFEEGEESAHCPSVPREGPHPWAVAWSADDSGTVDNGEYQFVVECSKLSGGGFPEYPGATTLDLLLTRAFVGEFTPADDEVKLIVEATDLVSPAKFDALLDYLPGDYATRATQPVDASITTSSPDLECTVPRVFVGSYETRANCLAKAAGDYSITATLTTATGSKSEATAKVKVTQRPAVQLSASTTDTMRGATTPVVITAQLVGLTTGLDGKAVTLFLANPSPLSCSSNSATTNAVGAATFSCSATGVGTASVSASFKAGTSTYGEVKPLFVNVLAPTASETLAPVLPDPSEDVRVGTVVNFKARVVAGVDDGESISTARGVPNKNVEFISPAGNATVKTDAQGFATHKVTATEPGMLQVEAVFFNDRTFNTQRELAEVEVTQPPLSVTLSVTADGTVGGSREATIATGGLFRVLVTASRGSLPVKDALAALQVPVGDQSDITCKNFNGGMRTNVTGQAEFECTISDSIRSTQLELTATATVKQGQGADATEDVASTVDAYRINMEQARYTMKINGANSVYGLWAPANTDYVFLRGWPVLWTITVRSSNGGSIKNKRVQLAPDNQLNCVNTDEYTNDKGVVTIRCTFDQGLLIPAASITVKLFGNDGMMTPLLSQQQYFAIVEAPAIPVIKFKGQKFTGSTMTVQKGKPFYGSVVVAAVPPTLTSILAGNTLTPVDVPDLLNCGQITLNFLGYASFSCTATATGTTQFNLQNPQAGWKNLKTQTITVVDEDVVTLTATPSASAVTPGSKFDVTARFTNSSGDVANNKIVFRANKDDATCSGTAEAVGVSCLTNNAGTCKVSCEVPGDSGTDTVQVYVTAPGVQPSPEMQTVQLAVTSAENLQPTLSCNPTSIPLGKTTRCTATIDPPDGGNISPAGVSVTFVTKAADGATCTPARGTTNTQGVVTTTCTFVKQTTTDIVARAGRQSAPVAVTVEAPISGTILLDSQGGATNRAGDSIKLTVTKVPSTFGPVTLHVTPQTPRLLTCDSMSDMPDLTGQAEFSCKFAKVDVSDPRQLKVVATATKRLRDGQNLDSRVADQITSNSLQLVISERADNKPAPVDYELQLFAKGFPSGPITVLSRDGLALEARVLGEGGLGVVGVPLSLDVNPDGVANCRPATAQTTSGGIAAFQCDFAALDVDKQVTFTASIVSERNNTQKSNTLTATVQVTTMPETVTALMEVNARAATRVDAGAKFTLVATVTGGPPDNKLLGGEVVTVSVRPNGYLECAGGLTMKTSTLTGPRLGIARKECSFDLQSPGAKTFELTTNNGKKATLQIEVVNVCDVDFNAPRGRLFHRRLVNVDGSLDDGGGLVRAAAGSAECDDVAEPQLTIAVTPASAQAVEGTGLQQQTFEARVTDASSGAPVTGKLVRMEISPAATLTCTPATPRTDTRGVARMTCSSANVVAGTYRLTAKVQACKSTRGTVSKDNWCIKSVGKASLVVKGRGALNVEMTASPMSVKLDGSFTLQVTSVDASSKPIPGVRITISPSPLNDAADPYGFTCTGASSSMVTDAAGVLRLTPCRFSKSPREGTVQVPITVTGTSPADSQLTDTDTVTMVLDANKPKETYAVSLTTPSVMVTQGKAFPMEVKLIDSTSKAGVSSQQIKYLASPVNSVKCTTLNGADWNLARTDATGSSRASCIASTVGRVKVTVSFVIVGQSLLQDSVDLNVQDDAMDDTYNIQTVANDYEVAVNDRFTLTSTVTKMPANIRAADVEVDFNQPLSGLLCDPTRRTDNMGVTRLTCIARNDVDKVFNNIVVQAPLKTGTSNDVTVRVTDVRPSPSPSLSPSPRPSPSTSPSPTPSPSPDPGDESLYRVTAEVDDTTPELSQQFTITATATDSLTRRAAPAGVTIRFYSALPAGVTCTNGALANTNSVGKATKVCTASTIGDKLFRVAMDDDKFNSTGTAATVRVQVVAGKYTIITSPKLKTVRKGYSVTLKSTVTSGGLAVGAGIELGFNVPVGLTCTAKPMTASTGIATWTCRVATTAVSGTKKITNIMVIKPPGAVTSTSDDVTITVPR